jgi:II/X family phage/plasmid replication protein
MDFLKHRDYQEFISAKKPVEYVGIKNGKLIQKEPEFFADKFKIHDIDKTQTQDLMIDWLTVKVPFYYPDKIKGGNITKSDQSGEVTYSIDTNLEMEGSHSSNLMIRTAEVTPQGETWLLSISGNPVKFFQGHNIFGTDDICGLIYETVVRLSEFFNVVQPPKLLNDVLNGHFTISRIDINCMYQMNTRQHVIQYLDAISRTARSRHGTAQTSGNTCYFGKNSKRWSVKCYSKGCEIERHKLHPDLQLPALIDYADNKLRIELTLRSNMLRELHLFNGSQWQNIDIFQIYKLFVGKLEMAAQDDNAHKIIDLPNSLKGTFAIWNSGQHVKSIIPKRTYYRHRKALLAYDIDIALLKPVKPTAKILSFTKVLEMKPAGIPEWARGTNLYFEPRKQIS